MRFCLILCLRCLDPRSAGHLGKTFNICGSDFCAITKVSSCVHRFFYVLDTSILQRQITGCTWKHPTLIYSACYITETVFDICQVLQNCKATSQPHNHHRITHQTSITPTVVQLQLSLIFPAGGGIFFSFFLPHILCMYICE